MSSLVVLVIGPTPVVFVFVIRQFSLFSSTEMSVTLFAYGCAVHFFFTWLKRNWAVICNHMCQLSIPTCICMFTVRVIVRESPILEKFFNYVRGNSALNYFCCIRSVIGLENHAFLPKQSRARPNTNHDWVTRVFPPLRQFFRFPSDFSSIYLWYFPWPTWPSLLLWFWFTSWTCVINTLGYM